MSAHIDLIDAQVKAFRARDLDGFLSCYAPDAVIKDGDGNVMMSGADAIRGMYGQLFRDSPDLSVTIKTRMAIGDYVIDEEELDGFVMTGYQRQVRSVCIYRISDGQIHELTLLA
jgi:uncharacterized protein (TIGR02246 family)